MKLQVNDTVILIREPEVLGIAESLDGPQVKVRLPFHGNKREEHPLSDLRPLAEELAERRSHGMHVWNHLNLAGESTLADLVSIFGYATKRLRQDSLEKVQRQLQRAGLNVKSLTGGWNRDDRFRLDMAQEVPEAAGLGPLAAPGSLVPVALPETFWPTAFGLPPDRELDFLHALMHARPILCILQAPDDPSAGWVQATWEGVMSWAFHSAQRFIWNNSDFATPEVQFGPASLLHTFLQPSVLDEHIAKLLDQPHRLNLVTIRKDADLPVEFGRLCALWPGPVFQFDPELSGAAIGAERGLSTDVNAILNCLLLAGGCLPVSGYDLCPLKTLLWSSEAYTRILTRAMSNLGNLLSENALKHFKGSNEGSTALALKADVAAWIRRGHKDAEFQFESHQVEDADDLNGFPKLIRRIDLFVKSLGRFEIESLVGSGPMEAFYHQKVFGRLPQANSPMWLVVPNEAVIWAGPFLADIAYHLGKQGHVLLPGLEDSYLELQGKPLRPVQAAASQFLNELIRLPAPNKGKPLADSLIRLNDVAGYGDIRSRIEELIIWPERHRGLFRQTSRSSGILFFGPPGCGKSRLARAIAGELEQEVRLLSPSDLRGYYIGWGQIQIREQFDWVAENSRRMLVIDELDAVAHSRREVGNMHSDEKANVNELLVQLDRVGRLGRLVVGTTNYVAALDDAVVRSGRFGRFIPVPPPTFEEAGQILDYYLQSLCKSDDAGSQPQVRVLTPQAVRGVLKKEYEQNIVERRFYCGADLEEAVNRAYLRRVRECVTNLPSGTDYATVVVEITGKDLQDSLQNVPRSVTNEAVEDFLEDIHRFCGSALKKQLSESLFEAK